MSVARDAAPETDRLVLSVNRSRDTDRIQRQADDAGLASTAFLPHWWDFLLAGALTVELATLRSRYWPEEQVRARLDELVAGGHVHAVGGRLTATERLRPTLDAFGDETTRRAHTAWRDHAETVTTLTASADRLADAATDDHVVARVHRALPRPEDPFARLHSRLVTLRYIRQHDHAQAWADHALTASSMVVLTTLWQGTQPGARSPAVDELVARGLVAAGGASLTATGQALRDEIEDETNRRAARTFEVLGDGADAFLTALRSLPSAGRN